MSQPVDAGVALHVTNLVADGVERGWEVAAASPSSGSFSRKVVSAGALHLPWEATRSPGVRIMSEVSTLRRAVADFRPTIVHLHSSKAGLAGRLRPPLPGEPSVVFQPNAWSFEALRGPLQKAARAWERRASQAVDALICVSEGEAERGRAAGVRAPLTVIRNGVDLERFRLATPDQREVAKAKLGLDLRPLVVNVGRLSEQKGQDILLRAWARVSGATLALVGDGPWLSPLKADAPPSVVFAGASDEVRTWLDAADLFVLPSRWEGMSFALLEALASGLPVIASDVAGAREAVGQAAGAVVPVGDHEALARELDRRLSDPRLREQEGKAARLRAEEMFDLKESLRATAELYQDISK